MSVTVTVSVKEPGVNSAKLNSPLGPDCNTRSPVPAGLVSTTRAPRITFPLVSKTVPEMTPEVFWVTATSGAFTRFSSFAATTDAFWPNRLNCAKPARTTMVHQAQLRQASEDHDGQASHRKRLPNF